ncbi:hypothetical protein LUR56_17215 [Streptomyces sp. MT29]|nr:hypothetical protein [Streptomyces sp. MT29]
MPGALVPPRRVVTSTDLLRAVLRAGHGPTDRRARKEEAGVARHAVRAVARTTPLSAFTAVGWGVLPTPSAVDRGDASWNGADLPVGSSRAVVRANRTLVDTLFVGAGGGPAPPLDPAAPHVQQPA